MYTQKEKKFIAKELFSLLEDEKVTMASIPRKEGGKSDLWVVRDEVFQDIQVEREQMRKWIWLLGKFATEEEGGFTRLDLANPNLGKVINDIRLLLADAGARFIGPGEAV